MIKYFLMSRSIASGGPRSYFRPLAAPCDFSSSEADRPPPAVVEVLFLGDCEEPT